MDKFKLATLQVIKKVAREPRQEHKVIDKNLPRAKMCEVFFSNNKWYALIGNDRYDLIVSDEDYENAKFAYSTPNNREWDYYTLRPFGGLIKSSNYNAREYWSLVYPGQKVYVFVENNIAKLDMEKCNDRNSKKFVRLKPTYYADRRC